MSHTTTTLPTPEDIARWIEAEHSPQHITSETHDDRVRITDGTAAFFIDIYIANGTTFVLEGVVYDEIVTDSCDNRRTALLDTLSHHI